MYVHCKLKYSLFKLSNFTLKNMKFVSRYLIMNMNLNKNIIFYEFTVAQAVQVGLAHNALASDHCAPVYRFTDATVQAWKCTCALVPPLIFFMHALMMLTMD